MLELGEKFEIDTKVDCIQIDRAEDTAALILREMSPSTCVETIADWEHEYGLKPVSDDLEARRQAVVAKYRTRSRSRKSDFERVARGLGYTIGPAGTPGEHLRIVQGDQWKPFRAGISKAGDKVYSVVSGDYTPWHVRVYGSNVESDSALQSSFASMKFTGITILYLNE
jgi:uncharacterized protein YmfQ (DUF2313 family)